MLDQIYLEAIKAIGYLLVAGIVSVAWTAARDGAKSQSITKVLAQGAMWCGAIALYGAMAMGSPTCINEEYGLHGSECYEYAENGYEPTFNQQAGQFTYLMVLLYTPVVIGALMGREKRTIV